jgi:hypothetical protein
MWREAMKGKAGRPKKGCESQPIKTDKGSGVRSYTVSRLQREAPELFAKVAAGEISANAAAIKAGFRKRKSPLDQLLHWWARCGEQERAVFISKVTP